MQGFYQDGKDGAHERPAENEENTDAMVGEKMSKGY